MCVRRSKRRHVSNAFHSACGSCLCYRSRTDARARARGLASVSSPNYEPKGPWTDFRIGAVDCPSLNSNRNRRTFFVFRMDFLLAGTLFSFYLWNFNAG